MLHNKRRYLNEKKPVHHNKEWPQLTAPREISRAAMKMQHNQKQINK